MKIAPRNRTMNRSSVFFGGRGLFASHLEAWAKCAALWLLFLVGVMQTQHHVQEVHALLPTSAQHHATIHSEEVREGVCDQTNDDASKPLSSAQHERHHAAKCAVDSHLAFSHLDTVSGDSSQWQSAVLDFVPAPPAPFLEIPASSKKSRASVPRKHAPRSLSHSFQSGRAPPLEA